MATPRPSLQHVPPPNQPATPKYGVRIPTALWKAAKRVAADRGETITDVIRRALEVYVRDHPLDDE